MALNEREVLAKCEAAIVRNSHRSISVRPIFDSPVQLAYA